MRALLTKYRFVWALLAGVALLAGGIALLGPYLGRAPAEDAHVKTAKAPDATPAGFVDLTAKTAELARIETTAAKLSDQPRTLTLRGSLAIDPNRLIHAHARFPGQIVEVASMDDPQQAEGSAKRPVGFMDRVTAGQNMAVLWSKDLGEKKSELVDVLARLRLDKQAQGRIEDLFRKGSTTERALREAERQVEVGEIAAMRAERTLRSWMLSDTEIDAVKAEAARLSRGEPNEKKLDDNWARLEITAPIDGTIVEKNVTVGDIVDTAVDLFKIADLSRLNVWLHAYEEDLPYLQNLPRPIPARLRLPSSPELGEIDASIERIGEIIDPNEHMALLIGTVDNSAGNLRAGQFVTASVQIPPEKGVVEVPTRALVDDGDETYVFVQADASQPRYERRQVAVTRRMHDLVYVREEPTAEEREQGARPMKPGDLVVSRGALQLEETYIRRQSPQ